MIGALMLAAQLQILAHAPDTAGVCEPIEVSVAVEARAGAPTPSLTPLALGPFDVLRSSATPHVSVDSRTGVRLAEFRYVLATGRTGTYTVGPFEARAGGMVVRSRPLQIVIRGVPEGERQPQVVARSRADTSFGVDLRNPSRAETVFVGQQVNYEVAVFLNQVVRDRMRRNPTFFPPDMQSMLAYDLPPLAGADRAAPGTRCFDALVYHRALFPLLPGRIAIPPAQLVYSLPLSASFFSREETRELSTDSAIVVAVEPPAAGRPGGYDGAVGKLAVSARLDTARARVGDPIVLTLRVAGTGNVKLFPRPDVSVPWGSVVNADERVDVDTTARRVRGSKEFDWLVTPHVAGELDLPPIRYPYFDPAARRYEVATTDVLAVRVAPGSLASADTVTRRPALAIRAAYGGPVAPPATRRPIFWAVLAVAPLPAAARRLRRRRLEHRPRRGPGQVLRDFARASSGPRDACALRRAYVGSFAERLGVEPQRFTRPGALEHALRRAGAPQPIAGEAERFLRALDEAAYSASGTLPGDAEARALRLFEHADREMLPRGELRLPPVALALVVSIGLATLVGSAWAAADAERDFARGVVEYAAGRYGAARDAFETTARAEPRAADAWANAGTAAWAAGDTASAVVGWQRALRLEPLAEDVRDRLDLVRPIAIGATGFVAPVPPGALACLALALWVVGWIGLVVPTVRRRPGLRRASGALAAIAAIAVLAALDLTERLDARQLGVVRQARPLVRVPALGAERVADVLTGELARLERREGAWTHVSLDDGRGGWVPTDAIAPLALPGREDD